MEARKVIGVVTERDLFALQRASMRGVRRTIAQAEDVGALRDAAAEIRALAGVMLEQGLAAEQLTYIVSTLNDALTERLIELERARHALGDLRWCWLAFGSEGRYEQTIATDQDNGIVFADSPAPDGPRARLVPFAKAVNESLAECGFPLCKGGIMAGNPQWCLSVGEWQTDFERWVRNTDEQELLKSVIFFDLRPVYGTRELAEPLRETRDAAVASRPVFLRQLAQYAVQSRPPLGFLGGFSDDDPSAPGTIDLKRSAARIFTDAARVFALAARIPHTNTAQRLRLAGARLNVPQDEIAAATEAFFFVQSLRMRAQLLAQGATAGPHNRVDPHRLNEVDRRMLKEAFRQARKLQSRLALDYQL
jgi:CBS domain-containing protein